MLLKAITDKIVALFLKTIGSPKTGWSGVKQIADTRLRLVAGGAGTGKGTGVSPIIV